MHARLRNLRPIDHNLHDGPLLVDKIVVEAFHRRYVRLLLHADGSFQPILLLVVLANVRKSVAGGLSSNLDQAVFAELQGEL